MQTAASARVTTVVLFAKSVLSDPQRSTAVSTRTTTFKFEDETQLLPPDVAVKNTTSPPLSPRAHFNRSCDIEQLLYPLVTSLGAMVVHPTQTKPMGSLFVVAVERGESWFPQWIAWLTSTSAGVAAMKSPKFMTLTNITKYTSQLWEENLILDCGLSGYNHCCCVDTAPYAKYGLNLGYTIFPASFCPSDPAKGPKLNTNALIHQDLDRSSVL
ncbi:hypothetical protein FA13DRAFT_1717545 [Coprinellus micaceus]|uniref:Uncharacterized protein n=1 Tax=Coprinellus micaceus TaxID=71717 RepID=A0A4Y7SFS5_COPMI|nr:hypothetical protein FA13DRAFT_1717545 [Coprinellus micaceus]